MEHTPGPWLAIQNSCFWSISVAEKPGGKKIREHDPSIAHVIQNYCYPHTAGEETEAANARLIAAAPDMLKALERVLEMHEDGETLDHREVRAIIAKAKGE